MHKDPMPMHRSKPTRETDASLFLRYQVKIDMLTPMRTSRIEQKYGHRFHVRLCTEILCDRKLVTE
jgi:hypothetical protein